MNWTTTSLCAGGVSGKCHYPMMDNCLWLRLSSYVQQAKYYTVITHSDNCKMVNISPNVTPNDTYIIQLTKDTF